MSNPYPADISMSNNEDIGQRLQLVRKIYDLTQRALSRRAEVTNEAISLIEQNRVSPSISSLKEYWMESPCPSRNFLL